MKVLLVSYHYAPENVIGALRATKLSKHLTDRGIKVDVITAAKKSNIDENFSIPMGVNIIEVEQSKKAIIICRWPTEIANILKRFKNGDVVEPSKIKTSPNVSSEVKKWSRPKIFNSIRKNILFTFRYYSFYDFLWQFKKVYKKMNINEYDVVISSFGPLPSILCGMYIKRKNRDLKWICDFRDPINVEDLPKLFKQHAVLLEKKACKNADEIIAVSQGYLNRIIRGNYSDRSHMIPNGYDVEDFIPINDIHPNKKFTLTYVGALYGGKRNLTPLFKALEELINEDVIKKEMLCFNYAGNEIEYILSQMKDYKLQDIIQNHGVLSRKDCLKLQTESRFLILSTWNNKGEEGVFPGKFLEYMLINRPIIGIVDGNLVGSEVSSVISEGNLGIAYESVQHDIDFVRLKEYIKKDYLRYEKGKRPDFHPNREVVERYNYKNIANQFLEIINN